MNIRLRVRAALLSSVWTVFVATGSMAEAPVRDPDLPWLDNEFYKLSLDVRARIGFADIEGFSDSQAYTIRTRAGLGSKPYYGFSGFAELENTWSLDDESYFDGVSSRTGKSLIADPGNTELNQAWLQFAKPEWLGARARGGRQRIVFDDARFVGNVAWRQNEQTFDAALGETTLGLEGLTAQYVYVWDVRRVFGNHGPTNLTRDWSSDSHLARVHYEGLERFDVTLFAYLLDFQGDFPTNSSNSYGLRATGTADLGDDHFLSYAVSYAYQTDAADNPVDYRAHYVWLGATLGSGRFGSVGAAWELLGSDDGKAVFVTPLATAHPFDGLADAFVNNGGPRGLQDLHFTAAPVLPWRLDGRIVFHEFWSDQGGDHLGWELDSVLARPINDYLVALAQFAWFDGTASGPADRWRLSLQLTFTY